MPHVILQGPVDLREFARTFQPVDTRWNNAVLKVHDCFVNPRNSSALLDALVVDFGPPKPFFIQINVEEQQRRAAVRIHPRSDVEKTDGVKRLVCEVAARVLAANPQCSYGNTNIAEFLVR